MDFHWRVSGAPHSSETTGLVPKNRSRPPAHQHGRVGMNKHQLAVSRIHLSINMKNETPRSCWAPILNHVDLSKSRFASCTNRFYRHIIHKLLASVSVWFEAQDSVPSLPTLYPPLNLELTEQGPFFLGLIINLEIMRGIV